MKRTLFELRSFLVLWFGQSISQLGSGMTTLALSIWAFQQRGTAMSVALLVVCSYLPSALLGLFAGAWIDRLPKKPVMLIADSFAALISLLVLCNLLAGTLTVEMLYVVNLLLGVSGAFQSPASQVAVSALVPKQHYLRVSGLQSFSGSLVSILSPVLAAAALAFGGLRTVLLIDLTSFAFAFTTLCLLHIPDTRDLAAKQEGFAARFREGLRFLRDHRGVSHLLRYLMLLNLIAGVGYYSILSPMVLARTGGDEMILGWTNSCIGLGAMAGAMLMTLMPARIRKVAGMCVAYTLSFAGCDLWLGVGRSPWVWYAAAFLGNLTLPYGDGCLTTLMRESVPLPMQGRVFAARNALTSAVIVIGYLLGATLADSVVEPLCAALPLLRKLVGEGPGRAMGLVFVGTSVTGIWASLTLLRDPHVRALEK